VWLVWKAFTRGEKSIYKFIYSELFGFGVV
jgi:hypothetical protein